MLGFLRRVTQEKTDRAVAKTRGAWFGHISSLFAGGRLDDETWEELEELLVAADVGAATAQELLGRVRRMVRDERVYGPEGALAILKREMAAMLAVEAEDPLRTEAGGPHVVLMVGVNGAGKTTSAAKLARLYLDQDKKVLLAAADTFRAAAIDQLQEWGRRLDLDVIAHQPGSDAGAVAFDAVEAGVARGADVVIVDTAGRLHTKFNLMEEIKKVHRVVSRRVPERSQTVVLSLDATTGQNGLLQARAFTEALECDGVFLAKLDSSAKGGIVFAIASELRIPVLFIGTGEQPDDVARFDAETFVESLFGGVGSD